MEKQLFLVLLIVQFLGYGYCLQCHSDAAVQKVNSVTCSMRNAMNYGEVKNVTWDLEDLHLGCANIVYRSQTDRLLLLQRGCYIHVASKTTNHLNGKWRFCRTEDIEHLNFNMTKKICFCDDSDFCNSDPDGMVYK